MARTFPDTLYVRIEFYGDISHFVADGNADSLVDAGETTTIATYKLVRTRKAKLAVTFDDKK